MAYWMVDSSSWRGQLDALDDSKQREIRRRMVENGAKVLIREMQDVIQEHHHVISGAMKEGIAAGDFREDIDGTSIKVWPQGSDSRGVSNEMKAVIINYGYYNVFTGARHKRTDLFLNEKFRKRCEPRIFAVMNGTFAVCMEELK